LLCLDNKIDTIILGCTHYPLLLDKIRHYTPENIQVIPQGEIIAESLKDYLNRHPEMETKCSRLGKRKFYTTESPGVFYERASLFCQGIDKVEQIELI
jgi:glutamate racemase